MSQYVVWFDSAETGAPVLNNAAGSLIAVLDACLVTGFNTKSITSLVVAAGVATATCAGHGFSGTYGKDLLIAGATPAGLNGRKALTYVDTSTFKFDATGIADQTATGTITAKRDSLGWVKQFAATGKAVYKCSDVTATPQMLRALDTAVAPATTTDARVFMVETATDIDTFTGQGPTEAQLSGGQYWYKGTSNTTAKRWILVGDGQFFYLFTDESTNSGYYRPNFFGTPVPFKSGDVYHTLLGGEYSASGSASNSTTCMTPSGLGATATQPVLALARLNTQTGASVRAALHAFGQAGGTPIGGTTGPKPNSPVDNGSVVSRPVLFSEDNSTYGHPIRGIMPGLASPLAQSPFGEKEIVSGLVGDSNKYLSIPLFYANSGNVLIDLTGPWR